MSIFNTVYFGVRLWIWLYLMFGVSVISIAVAYWQREQIKKFYYTVRFPEKVIKVVIHYKTGMFKTFYRIIPRTNIISVGKSDYIFDKDVVTKEHQMFISRGKKEIENQLLVAKDIFPYKKGKKEYFKIDGFDKYDYREVFQIKEKGRKYIEIHYMNNVPQPINFNFEESKIEFTSKQLKEFINNDLFSKLLTLKGEKTMMTLLMLLVAVNLVATFFVISKMMGWIQ